MSEVGEIAPSSNLGAMVLSLVPRLMELDSNASLEILSLAVAAAPWHDLRRLYSRFQMLSSAQP